MIKHPILLVILTLFCLTGYAVSPPTAPQIYQINVIVFQNAENAGLSSEIWPANPPQPKFAKAMDFLPAKTGQTATVVTPAASDSTNLASNLKAVPQGMPLLPSSQFGLASSLRRMQTSGKYQIITSLSWQQPLANPDVSKTLHLFAGTAYDGNGNVIDNPSVTPPQNPQPQTTPIDSLNVPASTADVIVLNPATNANVNIPVKWQLNGTLKVSKARFIEVSANLLLTEPVPVLNTDDSHNNGPQTQLTSFALNQTIRMRTQEIHYMDNPIYGVLIYITKVKN